MSTAPTLFVDDDLATEPTSVPGPFASVAIEQSVDRCLDYSISQSLVPTLRVGQRVKVPLGRNNHAATGYVVAINSTSAFKKIKPLLNIEDQRVLITPQLLALARWISNYYIAPLGTVLESVLPSAVRKRIGLGYTLKVRLEQEREQVQALIEQTRAPKRRAVLARLLLLNNGESVELNHLATEAGTTPATIRKLARSGLVAITSEADLTGLADAGPALADLEPDRRLNELQQAAFDDLQPRLADGGFSVNLIHGVTGSGKTEVYLHCIREVVAQQKQAIVLVPEIALTPQTVRRFTARFPRVAVLHSGLTATARHRYWQQIASGQAQVVVGARSAVFAPVPRLGVIVVDEEHEASYKQDTAPRYHARDVAVKRAQLEGVPVLLGSATPSLEMYHRVTGAEAGSAYHLLSLPARVRGLAMPHVELVDMKTQTRLRRGVHLLSQRLEALLQQTLAAGQQAILLLNRRGYSNFVFCSSCQNAIQCKFCDATMTYHRIASANTTSASHEKSLHTGHLSCHYCLSVNPLPDKCPHCAKKLSLFGLGTQRVEEELARKFPTMRFARVDSDTMRTARDYEALLGRFANGEIQVMLGTQMIAKGLDYPNVTLVGVISGDTALALPDFRAAERTFQLITQVAGRAGRGDAPGRVLLQTFLPEDPTIQAALRQDFVGFARTELALRREVALPPFARMVRILVRDEDPDKLLKLSEELAAQVNEAVAASGHPIRLRGPMPCAINRIAGYWRNQLVLVADRASWLQDVLSRVRDKGHLARSARIAVDVDPVSLL